jgi:hypothetical protein
MKERKELGVGTLRLTAVQSMTVQFDEAKHEVVQDPATKLFQVFRKRVPRDKTVKRSIRREGTKLYSYGKDARPIVVIIHPCELLETRLKGRRKGHVISWSELHAYLVRRDALSAIHARKVAKKHLRLERLAQRKQNAQRERIRRLVN